MKELTSVQVAFSYLELVHHIWKDSKDLIIIIIIPSSDKGFSFSLIDNYPQSHPKCLTFKTFLLKSLLSL